MARYVILAHKAFDYIYSKTGNMLIRYNEKEVVAVIDIDQAGKTAEEVLGWGGNIPCVASFVEAKKFLPTDLVIGTAPQGGILDQRSYNEIVDAIENNCNIISGMHILLNENENLIKKSIENNISLIDLRKPPFPPHFPKGTWKNRQFPVLLVVGSDCDTGKMTTAWEIAKRFKKIKKNVEFLGTGQTGILLSGNGVPIDAVKADFMAGEIERCLDQFDDNMDLVVVEGQGALNNMYYSGVTLGLLHGCMPDYIILTHEPNRLIDAANHPIPLLNDLIELYIKLMNPFKKTTFLGINLLTLKLDNKTAIEKIKETQELHKMPVTDLVRFNSNKFIDEIVNKVTEWK